MPHMSVQSLHLFGHGVEVFSIILLPRGLHSPKSDTVLSPARYIQCVAAFAAKEKYLLNENVASRMHQKNYYYFCVSVLQVSIFVILGLDCMWSLGYSLAIPRLYGTHG